MLTVSAITMTTEMKSRRKPCKLDAICAKLQQISNSKDKFIASNGDVKAVEGNIEQFNESPTDLSAICHNNNNNNYIIGKADIKSIEETSKKFRNEKQDQENASRDIKIKHFEIDTEASEVQQYFKTGNSIRPKQRNYAKETQKTAKVESSHRKSRKSSLPRSIPRVRDFYNCVDNYKDELTKYKISNHNTNISLDEDFDKTASDLLSLSKIDIDENISCSNPAIFKELEHKFQPVNKVENLLDPDADIAAPLDLSVNRIKDDDSVINDDSTSECDNNEHDNNESNETEDDDDFFHPYRNLVIDEDISMANSDKSSDGSDKYSGSEQTAHLKDFAESTMNELLSVYGFSSSGHQSGLSKHLTKMNFQSNLQQPTSTYGSLLPNPNSTGSTAQYRSHSESSEDDNESCDGTQSLMSFSNSSSNTGTRKLQNDCFTSSSPFINAIYNARAGNSRSSSHFMQGLPNYSKYLKRYNNGTECGGNPCKDLGYKEHYHCIDCSFQVFVKKEEMVRHYKWHRKREDSLQHGFLRFSPLDNCSKRFGPCTHNCKQTHYHCLQSACDKVYISTSDVQMHANYHRKDSAIMSEGFQRFRATEDCGTLCCAFYGQRTTHFHCLRSDCKFTFKNKADMEKHKSYHQKDQVLSRDGFKKFMKYEHCMYYGCQYSKVSNHIHCIRSGCDYVLNSTAQLYSHKRKHQRQDFENAYQKVKDISQSSCTPNNLILPKTDFRNLSVITNSDSRTFLQTVANVTCFKRMADLNETEPLELKKPKLELRSDIKATLQATPSARSTPGPCASSSPDENNKTETIDFNSSSSVDSSESFQTGQQHLKMDEDNGESLNQSAALKLPIPKFIGTSNSPPALSTVQGQKSSSCTNILSSPVSAVSVSHMSGTLGASLIATNPSTAFKVTSLIPGSLTALQPPKTVYTERKERDESWKTYLVRYTANDPCIPHCHYLYKDHYHCKMDGCLVLFKSKDGVREHARCHKLQDQITPKAYQTYDMDVSCPDRCQYSEKEKHYHCIWTGCTHVVPYVGPIFDRLQHYRVHEYARTAAGKSCNHSGEKPGSKYDDSNVKRRGRPPKYPKIELPRIPNVELSNEETQQSQFIVREFDIPDQMKVINGFRVFSSDDPCPDDQCSYNSKLHYHCARPRCFTITDRFDVLNLHSKDFHSFINILENYEFFDRNVSCHRLQCPNNQKNRHFHCMRPKCDYSFIRHSTMTQHEKKHQLPGNTNSILTSPPVEVPVSPMPFNQVHIMKEATNVTSATRSPTSVITSAEFFLPMSRLEQAQNIPVFFPHPATQIASSKVPIFSPQAIALQAGNHIPILPFKIASVTSPDSQVQALPSSVVTHSTVAGLSALTVCGSPSTTNAINNSNVVGPIFPLAAVLQRGMNQISQPSWNDQRSRMHYAVPQNCDRPFGKLKKKDHYHCSDCNQAFSDQARLQSHMGKHRIKIKQTSSSLFLTKHANHIPRIELKSLENKESDLDLDEAKCFTESTRNDSDSDKEHIKSSSLNLNPATFSEMISKDHKQNKMSSDEESVVSDREIEQNDNGNEYNVKIDDTDMDEEILSDSAEQIFDTSSSSGSKIIKTKHKGFINCGEINFSKSNNSALKANKFKTPKSCSIPQKGLTNGTQQMRDNSIPDGYSRWRYNEECKYLKCAYRHSVTHFHCLRDDCGYGFSDRSRLLQHTLRHGRIDSITGGELQQYRINQDCENMNCDYNQKMSHYHCKLCAYSCTDSSKVLTHRKHHAKMDKITSQGFQKHLAADDCGINLCPYARKQNHFHCLIETCRTSLLGPIQMTSHKLKHANE